MAVLTIESVTKTLEECKGNMAAVGRTLKVTRQAVWDFCDKHDELKAFQRQLRESFVDTVESGLYTNAENGNVTAQIFILKTIGRDRGYVERHEIAGPNGPVEVMVKHVKRDSNTD